MIGTAERARDDVVDVLADEVDAIAAELSSVAPRAHGVARERALSGIARRTCGVEVGRVHTRRDDDQLAAKGIQRRGAPELIPRARVGLARRARSASHLFERALRGTVPSGGARVRGTYRVPPATEPRRRALDRVQVAVVRIELGGEVLDTVLQRG